MIRYAAYGRGRRSRRCEKEVDFTSRPKGKSGVSEGTSGEGAESRGGGGGAEPVSGRSQERFARGGGKVKWPQYARIKGGVVMPVGKANKRERWVHRIHVFVMYVSERVN